jgi:lipoteichoic acid synthase|tara:strand:- start:55 stop:2283 length:2229 start_codon:yes stop_codon:yes gene_type:complete
MELINLIINQFGGKKDVFIFVIIISLFILVNSLINNRKIRFLTSTLASLFLTAQVFSLYSTQSFIGYQFYVHLNLRGVLGMENLFLFQISILIIFYIFLMFTNFYSYFFWRKLKKNNKSNKKFQLIRFICIVSFISIIIFKGKFVNDTKTLLPIFTSNKITDFKDVLIKYNMSDYTTPGEIESTAGNNIIIISMESLEKGYLNEKHSHLTPNLKNLKDNWNYFKMEQNGGSGWTSGSLYTCLTGFPAYFGVQGNSMFQNAYHSNISSISHVLENSNYQTTYLIGNSDFAGTKEMLNVLHFNKIIDYKNYPKTGYESGYGLRDMDLFSIAKSEIKNQIKSDKPFAMFVSTTDTHFPNGIYDERMESFISPKKTDLEFTVAALDYLVGDFISYLQKNNLLENTTIFLFPDHLKMGDPSIFDDTGKRELYIITNKENKRINNKDIYQIDLPRIILEGSKVKHNLKFLSDYIKINKKQFIEENILTITEINTNGISNPKITYLELDVSNNYLDYKKDNTRFIAHAGGEIDNKKYSNSLEALNLSYKKGFKLFELDIIKTSDGKFVAAHDWNHWKKITKYNDTSPVTLKKFLSKKVFGKYTPLDMVAINDWFNNHTDAILVTDKINEPLIFSELFVDKSRLMMELFDEESLQKGLKSKILSAMPSQSIIDNMKIKDVEKFAQKGVKNIAISRRFILQNKLLLKEFKKFGIKPFVYHINFDPGINEDYVVKYEMDFIYGIYADEWKFK